MLGAGMAGVKEKVSGLFRRGGKGGGGKKLKLTNIVESTDMAVPVTPGLRPVDAVRRLPELHEEGRERRQTGTTRKPNWKAQVFWSHRNWEATISQQLPDERIVWSSKGQKGHVDGAVTFHELGPDLTRVLLVLEYHPQGMFEHTGNMWRAQGRRVRLELKHFQRHLMTQASCTPTRSKAGAAPSTTVRSSRATRRRCGKNSRTAANGRIPARRGRSRRRRGQYARRRRRYDATDDADDER